MRILCFPMLLGAAGHNILCSPLLGMESLLGKRRTPHIKEAHESYLMSKSLISRLAGGEKMAQRLLSARLILSSIWEKARARDGL
jgi:hypothetical protein